MDLRTWINSVLNVEPGQRLGRDAMRPVATLLGENPRTVYSWYRLERAPSLRAAVKIVLVSKNRIDYNGIYSLFAAKLADGTK